MRPEAIATRLVDRLLSSPSPHPLRIVVDAPPWSGLDLAGLLAEELQQRGRPVLRVDAGDFLRPASVRLERGRDDPDAYLESWVDVDAMRREVVDPAGDPADPMALPTLWDAERDRATRAGYVRLLPSAVVVVSGWFLLGRGLDAELTVHVALSAAARARRVPAEDATRELPAWDRYDAEIGPAELADVVVRADDPRRPALLIPDARP